MERVLQSRYRIVRALGRGGLGAVFLCEDLRLPSKHWAIKQMHRPEEELRDRFRETFEREAAILARLRHPNLPLVVDFFEEDDDAYLVMEYVEGENLAEHVRRIGPLPEGVAFRHGLMLADLLAFLHSQDPPLIFRDLKPENVMLTPDRTIKLIDFGLARRFVPGKRNDTMPSGSVGYAAPEQWEDLSQTDERSDIYSWGATMAHLLTGKIPSPVFPLSVLRGLETPLSEPGRAILARCVKARPSERYSDSTTLSREVRRHLEAIGEDGLPRVESHEGRRRDEDDEHDALARSESEQRQAGRSDSGVRNRSDSGVRNRSDSGVRSRSDSGVRNRSDSGVRNRSDSGVRNRSDSGVRDRSDSGVRDRSDSGVRDRSDSGVRARSDSGVRARSDSGVRGRSDSGVRARSDSGVRARSDSGVRDRSDSGVRDRIDSDVRSDAPRRRSTDSGARPRGAAGSAAFAGARAPMYLEGRLPLALLILATLAFVNALISGVARGGSRAVPSAVPSAAASRASGPNGGVGPYQMSLDQNRDKEQGRQMYESGRFDQAIAALDRATTQAPQDAEAAILKENAYIRTTGVPFYRIPVIVSVTGVDGPDSFTQLHGIALAQATLNQRGGIGGRKILVDIHDDHSSTSDCLNIAERLIHDKDVFVVLGPYNSQRALAVAPLFNGAHVDLVAPVASAAQMWEAGPYVFSASDSTERRVRALARYAVKSGYRKVAVVVDETSQLSGEMRRTFDEEVRGQGVERIDLPTFKADSDDFSRQVEAARTAAPDLIFFADYRAATIAHFMKQLREAHVETPVIAQTVPFSRELVELGGPAVDGLVLAAYFHPEMNTSRSRAFMASFRRKFGDLTPTHITVNTFDAFMAVAEGLEKIRAQSALPPAEALNAFFHASGVKEPSFDGVLGSFALGRLLDARPVWLIEVRNQRYVLLEQAPEAAPPAASPQPSTAR